jgi:hypothetical protein
MKCTQPTSRGGISLLTNVQVVRSKVREVKRHIIFLKSNHGHSLPPAFTKGTFGNIDLASYPGQKATKY